MWKRGTQSCSLPTEEEQLFRKLDEVTGEGPPLTGEKVESLITQKPYSNEEPSSTVKPLKQHSLSERKHVAQLIGCRCMVTCHLDEVKLQMLLDSGAQVSIVEKSWVETALPNVMIQPLESLLPHHPLKITAANGMDVPYDGWIEVLLEITSSKRGSVSLCVPVLVSQEHVRSPFHGFKVIQEIIMGNSDQTENISLVDLLSQAW